MCLYFHVGVSEGSEMKLVGQPKTMVHNAFTVFIYEDNPGFSTAPILNLNTDKNMNRWNKKKM